MNFSLYSTKFSISRRLTAVFLIVTSFLVAAYAPFASLTSYAESLEASKTALKDLVLARQDSLILEKGKLERALENSTVYRLKDEQGKTLDFQLDRAIATQILTYAQEQIVILDFKITAIDKINLVDVNAQETLLAMAAFLNSTYALNFATTTILQMINTYVQLKEARDRGGATIEATNAVIQQYVDCVNPSSTISPTVRPTVRPTVSSPSPSSTPLLNCDNVNPSATNNGLPEVIDESEGTQIPLDRTDGTLDDTAPVVDGLGTRFIAAVKNIEQNVLNFWDGLKEKANTVVQAAAEGISNVVGTIIDGAKAVTSAIANGLVFVADVVGKIFSITQKVGQFFIDKTQYLRFQIDLTKAENRKGQANDYGNRGVTGEGSAFVRYKSDRWFDFDRRCTLDISRVKSNGTLSTFGQKLTEICKQTLLSVQLNTSVTWHYQPVQIMVVGKDYKDSKLGEPGWCNDNETNTNNLARSIPEIGRIYVCGAKYFNDNPSDYTWIVRELGYMTQNYSASDNSNNWIVSGIPEFVRNKLGYTSTREQMKCDDGDTYKNKSTCAAAFLNYMVKKSSDKRLVKKLHLVASNAKIDSVDDLITTAVNAETVDEAFTGCLNDRSCSTVVKVTNDDDL